MGAWIEGHEGHAVGWISDMGSMKVVSQAQEYSLKEGVQSEGWCHEGMWCVVDAGYSNCRYVGIMGKWLGFIVLSWPSEGSTLYCMKAAF